MRSVKKSLDVDCWQIVTLLLASGYTLFVWLYKIDLFPGLHGDEAWAGILAIEGIHSLQGMNNYTGAIEPLVAGLSFKLLGVGVMQLRLPGIFLNLIAIAILFLTTHKTIGFRGGFVFFALFLQSAFLSLTPRVAWEVNSLTLILIAVIFLWYVKQDKRGFTSTFDYIFLVTGIIGAYNHVIFSSLAVALFLAHLIWAVRWHQNLHNRLYFVLGCNLLNAVIVFIAMRYFLIVPSVTRSVVAVSIITLLPAVQVALISRHRFTAVEWYISFRKFKILINGLLCLGMAVFAYFHGIAFVELLQNEKVLLQLFSFEPSILFRIFWWVSALVFIIYLTLFVLKDIREKKASLHAFSILCYMITLSAFTQKTSFRYYLILCVLLSLYMAYSIVRRWEMTRVLRITISISLILVQSVIVGILMSGNMPVKVHEFTVGNGQKETSAHFLPKQPLIEFLKENRIGKIMVKADDPYFILQPVLFYEKMNPWRKDDRNIGVIRYNDSWYGSGFIMYQAD